MAIEDIAGLGKALEKLLDVASKGAGVIFEPITIKRRARAEAEAFKIKADGLIKALEHNPEGTVMALMIENPTLELKKIESFSERAIAARDYRAQVELNNLEVIIAESVKYLGSSPSVEEVDIDWRTRFFNKAKDVSQEDMQEVWSKILAGEVTKPGSYSLRTMELLSNLSAEEAELFRKLSAYVIEEGLVLIPHRQVQTLGFSLEINFTSLLKLQDAGLVMPKENLGVSALIPVKVNVIYRYSHGFLFLTNTTEKPLNIRLDILKLTAPGLELTKLLNSSKWADDYEDQLARKHPGISVSYKSREK